MVTELKERQEAQVMPASREETIERLNAIEQALSELHSNPAIPEKDLQAIRSQLDDIRNGMQGQQKHIEDTKKIALETYRKYSINSLVYWVTYVHNVVYSFYRSMIYCYIYKPQNKMFRFYKTFCSRITLINTNQNVILNPI